MERSYFDGTVLQLVGYSLLAGLLTAVTLGIGYPWALCMLKRWETKHTYIESKRLNFDGKGLQLLGMWIMLAIIPLVILCTALYILLPVARSETGSIVAGFIFLALLIAALFYGYFVQIQIKKWTVRHTDFEVHLLQATPGEVSQPVPVYTQPGPGPRPVPAGIPYRTSEPDWLDKIAPALPLVYILWFCGISAGVFFLLKLIFK